MSDSSTRSITIRLDADLFQAIKEVAAGNSRSMNAEISARLATSLNQDAWWEKDPAWPMQDKWEQPHPSHEERVEQLHQRMSIIMKEWSALSDGLGGLPDVMKGIIIRRLSELEQERSKLDGELRLIDPDYRDNH